MIHSPFDPLPTEAGEYTALMVSFDENKDIPNRRWFDGRNWSGPYFSNDTATDKVRARSKISEFNLYWKSK